MNIFRSGFVLIASSFLMACGQEHTPENSEASAAVEPAYIVLGEDLQQLKDNFNENTGKVRLVFINGPTCGICLRGMADLNDAFIAEAQGDGRLHTFVVHVPTLGAEEKHVADSIPLLSGPDISHYWEDSGIIGSHFQDVMDVDMYVWDFWAIYDDAARWDGILPPAPDYFEHQLGGGSFGNFRGFPRDKRLDAERFAGEAHNYMDAISEARVARVDTGRKSESELVADGTVIPVVAQPRGVAIQQHIVGRGGYQNLKRIQSIAMTGKVSAEGQSLPLRILASRPNQLSRTIMTGATESVASFDGDSVTLDESDTGRGLPYALESTLLSAFDFDGPLVEWPEKGNETQMLGMEKIGNVLAWKLDLVQKDGPHWHLFVDSHSGAVVKAYLLDENDRTQYVITQSDFREVSGYTFPHTIAYMDAAGRQLAVDTIDTITVDSSDFDISDEPVSH